MSCGVGSTTLGSNLALLWLWCRPAAAGWIPLLTYEPKNTVAAVHKKNTKKKGKTFP